VLISMELPAPYLLAGVFLAGVLVGYVIRALISAVVGPEPAVATDFEGS
jgi:xanthosine utilization system XapX-like protein